MDGDLTDPRQGITALLVPDWRDDAASHCPVLRRRGHRCDDDRCAGRMVFHGIGSHFLRCSPSGPVSALSSVLRNFGSYSTTLAGDTAAMIAADNLGATVGAACGICA
jgi:hypothetical protein